MVRNSNIIIAMQDHLLEDNFHVYQKFASMAIRNNNYSLKCHNRKFFLNEDKVGSVC